MVMARIYTRCGMYDEALVEIDYLLSLESDFTVNDFKMDRDFIPLLDLPEFQALVEKYALPVEL
jgi:hypothetical protein